MALTTSLFSGIVNHAWSQLKRCMSRSLFWMDCNFRRFFWTKPYGVLLSISLLIMFSNSCDILNEKIWKFGTFFNEFLYGSTKKLTSLETMKNSTILYCACILCHLYDILNWSKNLFIYFFPLEMQKFKFSLN